MPSAPTIDSTVAVIQEACDRNVPVELHYPNPDLSPGRLEPDLLFAQTRLIGVDEKEIYLDSPQSIGKSVELKHRTKVSGYFNLDGKIYSFNSRVTNLGCEVVLNKKKRIVGMCLATPAKIRQSQKREDHRISVAALEPIEVRIHEVSQKDPNAVALTAKRFTSRAVNLSLGGEGVNVEGPGGNHFRVGQYYFVSFCIPNDPEEFLFLAESRHIMDLPRNQAKRIGLQFLRWPDVMTMRKNLRKLGPFLARTERNSLQKQKG